MHAHTHTHTQIFTLPLRGVGAGGCRSTPSGIRDPHLHSPLVGDPIPVFQTCGIPHYPWGDNPRERPSCTQGAGPQGASALPVGELHMAAGSTRGRGHRDTSGTVWAAAILSTTSPCCHKFSCLFYTSFHVESFASNISRNALVTVSFNMISFEQIHRQFCIFNPGSHSLHAHFYLNKYL